MTDRILKGVASRQVVGFPRDGALADPDTGTTPTVEVARDSDGAVSSYALEPLGGHLWGFTLPGQDRLDLLSITPTAQFDGSVDTFPPIPLEVVGGFYVPLDQLAALADLSGSTPDELAAARQWFEVKFELYTGRAFVPRYRHLRQVPLPVGTDLYVRDKHLRTVRSVRINGTGIGVSLNNIVPMSDGRLVSRFGWPSLNISQIGNWPEEAVGLLVGSTVDVAYEHGLDWPSDDIAEAGKLAMARHLLDGRTQIRERSAMTDMGIVRYATPGPRRPFGIDEVDEVANFHKWEQGLSEVRFR